MARADYWFRDEDITRVANTGGGGVRLLWNATLSVPVYEIGISEFAPNGIWPAGPALYRQLQQTQADYLDSIVITMAGFLVDGGDRYTRPDEWGKMQWRSRRVNKSDALDIFYPFRRGAGGTGRVDLDPNAIQPTYGPEIGTVSEFTQTLSYVTGHDFTEVGCVRCYGVR